MIMSSTVTRHGYPTLELPTTTSTVVRTGREAPGAKGLSAFVVDAANPGLRVTEIADIMAPHPVGSLEYSKLPRGKRAACWGSRAMDSKSPWGRSMSSGPTAAACAIGLARRALDEARAWIQERRLFGRPLAEFQNTQMRVADMAVDIDAAALLVYRARLGQGPRDRAPYSQRLDGKTVRLGSGRSCGGHGSAAVRGNGCQRGTTIERLLPEARLMRIYEGTSEIQRLIIGNDVIKEQPGTA